jgi:hypothetical protein
MLPNRLQSRFRVCAIIADKMSIDQPGAKYNICRRNPLFRSFGRNVIVSAF